MKRLYLVVVLFFLVIGFSTISWAEGFLPLEGSLGVGARLYGVFPKGDSIRGQKLDFDNEVGGEVTVTYRFLKYLALEGGVGYTELDIKNKTLGVDWATIEAVPIFATLQFRWVSKKPEQLKWIVPYAGIGGGYYLLEIEERSELRNYWFPLGVNLEIDDTFFFHLAGGFDIFLTNHLALNFDARYAWAKTDVDERLRVGLTARELGDTISLNAAFIGAGFKFYF
jgi:outer membrane protein W